MGWSKDHGTAAKVNAEYAKEQGNVAKQEATNLAELKSNVEAATQNASTAAENANAVIENANTAASNADSAASEAIAQANHAKNEGDRAKAEADRLAGTDVSVLDNKIGSLSSLNTTNKTSVVASVNEVTTQLAQSTQQLNDISINLKTFKVIGATDDTQMFKEAFAYAFANGYKLRIPKSEVPYQINSNENWNCPQIVSDGAVINITGNVRFLLSKNVFLENFTIITNDGGGYGAADKPLNGSLFKPKSSSTEIEWAHISGIAINGNVIGDKRITGGITVPKFSKWANINNVYGKNIGILLTTAGISYNLSVRDIYGENIETLVYTQNVDNAVYDALSIKNTKEQSVWWMNKNNGTDVSGKDVLLIEYGSKNIRMTNIKGEYCIERPVYCQASKVFADNLESINCGGSKFVGNPTNVLSRVKDVHVGTMIIRCNDGTGNALGQVYGCENINFENIKLYFDEPSGSIAPFIIEGNNGNVKFGNVESIGYNQTLFRKVGGITNSVTIDRIKYHSNATVASLDGVVISKDTVNTTSADIINTLTINNIDCVLGTNFKGRHLLFYTGSNLLANKIDIKNVLADSLSLSSQSIYGSSNLTNLTALNLLVKSTFTAGNLQGANLFATDIIANKRLSLTIRKDNEANLVYEIKIKKDDEASANILNYINEVIYTKLASNDTLAELPAKASSGWLIKVRSKVGGYAEFRMISGTLTEVLNTSTNIVIGSTGVTPSSGKFTLWISSGNYLSFRNRINADDFEIKVEKLTFT